MTHSHYCEICGEYLADQIIIVHGKVNVGPHKGEWKDMCLDCSIAYGPGSFDPDDPNNREDYDYE